MTARLATPSVALAAAVLLALTGCAGSDTASDQPTTSPTTASSADSSSTAAESVTIEDAWVKAAESGMSAAFGDLTNSGTQDVTVTSVTTSASTMVELHETVEDESGEMVMREKDGGFTIPAGGEMLLEPGGNHIMLMDLVEPLVPGAEVTLTLTFSDESTVELTAPVKDYSGANESYEEGETDIGETDMDDMDDTEMDMGE
ncbi:copper chaperone PCu(A)C [Sanguibacter sp. 25GB23B1]|uniref:copper chaperone PCu(A)C n=1 Tax=unclassified Sanguibacter TaxID=2645534 RepID=UPI0032AEA11A